MIHKLLIAFLLITVITAKDSLNPNECLLVNQTLVSSNGCFVLILQGDGNLVIYRKSNNKPTWSTRTWRTCVNRVCMQGDGNFVAYDRHNKAKWSSRTHKHEGSSIVLQNDGNLVIYAWNSRRAIWSSRSVTHC
jgi:hypothetical protein